MLIHAMSCYSLRTLRWLFLVCILASVLVERHIDGTAVSYAQSDIQVIASSAQPDFPNLITFSVTAESSAARITEIELLYGATRSDTFTVVPTTFDGGQQVKAQHVLDTQIYNLPPGIDLTYRWVIRDAAGNELETPLQELVYHDDRFPWQQLTERGVTIYWYEGDAAFGNELMQTATRTLDRLQQEIGAVVKDPIKIYAYANIRDMRSVLAQNEVEWVGGFAQPGLGLVVVTIEEGNLVEARRLIPHELSHQVLHQAVDNPYGGLPLWFDEGLAVYNQETANRDFPLMVELAARTDQLIPLEALAASFPADPERARLSYAQSYSMVDYISKIYGTEKLRDLVATFHDATPVEEAIPQVLGLSIDALDEAWRKTLPPAQVSAPLEAGPSVAPADRFTQQPVLPAPRGLPDGPAPGAMPQQPGSGQSPRQPVPDVSPTFIPGSGVPFWFGVALAVIVCGGLTAITAIVLFITWRLSSVGKRS